MAEEVKKSNLRVIEYAATRPMVAEDIGQQSTNGKHNVTNAEAIITIVNHIVKAKDLELLQLSPIPRNAIFDFCFSIVQRAVLDEEVNKYCIPLSKIFDEAYLRALRGASGDLSRTLGETGRDQIQIMNEKAEMESTDA